MAKGSANAFPAFGLFRSFALRMSNSNNCCNLTTSPCYEDNQLPCFSLLCAFLNWPDPLVSQRLFKFIGGISLLF